MAISGGITLLKCQKQLKKIQAIYLVLAVTNTKNPWTHLELIVFTYYEFQPLCCFCCCCLYVENPLYYCLYPFVYPILDNVQNYT